MQKSLSNQTLHALLSDKVTQAVEQNVSIHEPNDFHHGMFLTGLGTCIWPLYKEYFENIFILCVFVWVFSRGKGDIFFGGRGIFCPDFFHFFLDSELVSNTI